MKEPKGEDEERGGRNGNLTECEEFTHFTVFSAKVCTGALKCRFHEFA